MLLAIEQRLLLWFYICLGRLYLSKTHRSSLCNTVWIHPLSQQKYPEVPCSQGVRAELLFDCLSPLLALVASQYQRNILVKDNQPIATGHRPVRKALDAYILTAIVQSFLFQHLEFLQGRTTLCSVGSGSAMVQKSWIHYLLFPIISMPFHRNNIIISNKCPTLCKL